MPRNAVHQYARQVVSGKEIAGPYVRAQCQRHLDDLKRKDVAFDAVTAQRAMDYFPLVLRHSIGQFADQPFELHPSQQFIVGSVYGWKKKIRGIRPEQCPRRYRRVYIEEAKGMGKTPLIAGMGLFGFTADGERGAEIYIGAGNEDQARICFGDMVNMIRTSPQLAERLSIVGDKLVKKIMNIALGAMCRPVSSNAARQGSGFRPHVVILDELHEQKGTELLETMERNFKHRTQPLLLMITNAGIYDEKSVCWIEHEYATKVALGHIHDDTVFPYVCALDEGEDPIAQKPIAELIPIWRKANPLLDTTMQIDELTDIVSKARVLPGYRNAVLRWHFCKWTAAKTAWISEAAWSACERKTLKLEMFYDLGLPLYIGLDLSQTNDMTAVAFLIEVTTSKGTFYIAFVKCYTPNDTLEERSRRDMAPYRAWVDDGHLIATPGSKVTYETVALDLTKVSRHFDTKMMAYDTWMYEWFKYNLGEAGGEHIPTKQHGQGFNKPKEGIAMPQSIEATERLIFEQRIIIAWNPVLRMAVSGAAFAPSPSGLRKFVKGASNSRIDALIALVESIGAACEPKPTKPSSPWDDPEFSWDPYGEATEVA